MNFFKSFNTKESLKSLFTPKDDFDSVEGIRRINTYTADMTYTLQRRASQHKRDGNMDLAIECLKKANEIYDSGVRDGMVEKEYERIVSYLKLAGREEEAISMKAQIEEEHPEFHDRRYASRMLLERAVQTAKRFNERKIICMASSSCPDCKDYNNKIYDVYNLPDDILAGGKCKRHSLDFGTYYEDLD